MWNEPTEAELGKIPSLNSTVNIEPLDKIIYQHFFIFNSDWYVAEYDSKQRLFFGYVILERDYQNAEWGYFDYDELREINIHGFEIDRDLDWEPKKTGEIEKIVKCHERNY